MIEVVSAPNSVLRVTSQQSGVRGKIQVPGDKSISHRALFLGALAQGTTKVSGLLLGEDPRSTAACFRALGAQISPLNSDQITIEGVGGDLQEPLDILDAGNSGTTMRLILGVLASQPGKFFSLTGDRSLRSRPMARVTKPLRSFGAQIWGRESGSKAPLAVLGMNLTPSHYFSPIASAQVKSCLLLAGLNLEAETIITEPERSRDHSERMLKAFGADLRVEGNTVHLRGGAKLQGQTVVVPGDISSAAYWLVAASIVPGSELLIENVGVNPTRTGILEVLLAMGADITQQNYREVTGEPVADLLVRSASLQGVEIKGAVIPRLIDEIPILAVAAACADGKTVISDAAELRVKESDRISAMVTELLKLGVDVSERADGMEIVGGRPLHGCELQTYEDHRVAMSLAIAGLVAQGDTEIAEVDCIKISYPDFMARLLEVTSGWHGD
ncbi:MAG: 3-phosphoshikimate 1-carboxyvinyltransferase [Pseudanabaenaceae cyanobacterium bins.68]|nr:3-phosphoshikimate 1-carboxyvinyltransferase [Pseudanabaenaceae cyanobacterium bins.68]